MTSGLISFIFNGENKSFGVKERIILIVIYMIQAIMSLYNLVALMTIRLTLGFLGARTIVLGFFGVRMFILVCYASFAKTSRNRPFTRKMYFCVANLNMPVHFGALQNDDENKMVDSGGYTEFVFVWSLNIIDNILKTFFVVFFASDEVLSETLLHFRRIELMLCCLSAEALVFILISLYFRKCYLWRDVVFRSYDALEDQPKHTKPSPTNEEHISDKLENDKEDESLKGKKVNLNNGPKLNMPDLEPNEVQKATETPNKKPASKWHKRDSLNIVLMLLGASVAVSLSYVAISYRQVIQIRNIYTDCHEVYQTGSTDPGLYEIASEYEKPRFTYCENGMTLIQKTNNESGNRNNYFKRSLKSYVDGFGLTSGEYWIGLRHVWALNKNNNDVLRVEGTFHNGSKFWVEYQNFHIEKKKLDETKYQLKPYEQIQRNRMEQFPITSLKQTKSFSPTHRFVIIRPNYLKTNVEKIDDRELGINAIKGIHDRFYAGFSTQVK